MRFKKGCKIEVLQKRALESWCPAIILSGNGHTYCVRYERSTFGDGQPFTERVPRKAIRPCPPFVGGAENWLPGDMVEVFDDGSWKPAKISEVIQVGLCFFVQFPGSSRVFKAYASDIRIQQSWLDDQWVPIGKTSRIFEAEKTHQQSRCYEKPTYRKSLPNMTRKVCTNHSSIERGINSVEFHKASSRSLKRGSQLCTTHIKSKQGACKKTRVEKDEIHHKWALGHPSQLLEKVDAAASPEKMLGDEYMLSSFINKMPRSTDMGKEREILNVDERFLIKRSLESDDDCSIASCSSNSPRICISQYPNPDTHGNLLDTESSSGKVCNTKCFFPTEEGLAAEIHRLELHAYRSTMEALYASGSLSWEQEVMMTNLRIELHISNDEHLLELRQLVSSKQAFL